MLVSSKIFSFCNSAVVLVHKNQIDLGSDCLDTTNSFVLINLIPAMHDRGVVPGDAGGGMPPTQISAD